MPLITSTSETCSDLRGEGVSEYPSFGGSCFEKSASTADNSGLMEQDRQRYA